MQCPLCGGPLHVEDGARFLCERDHELDAEQMRVAVSAKVTNAFWMAIEALESEAEGLRVLSTLDGGNGSLGLADQAEADARILRDLAQRHLADDFRAKSSDGAK